MIIIHYAMNSLKRVTKPRNSTRHAKLLDKSNLWRYDSLKYLTVYRTKNKAGRDRNGAVACFTKGSRVTNRLRSLA